MITPTSNRLLATFISGLSSSNKSARCDGLRPSLASSARAQVKTQLPSLLVCCLLFGHANLDAQTLCGKREHTAFSCSVGRKVTSLCIARGNPNEASAMFYRFGSPNRVELSYPERAILAKKAFTSSLNLWSYDGSVVRFRVGKYVYSLYRAIEVEGGRGITADTKETESGLTVRRDGKLVSRMICTSSNSGTRAWWYVAIQEAALETDAQYLEEP